MTLGYCKTFCGIAQALEHLDAWIATVVKCFTKTETHIYKSFVSTLMKICGVTLWNGLLKIVEGLWTTAVLKRYVSGGSKKYQHSARSSAGGR